MFSELSLCAVVLLEVVGRSQIESCCEKQGDLKRKEKAWVL